MAFGGAPGTCDLVLLLVVLVTGRNSVFRVAEGCKFLVWRRRFWRPERGEFCGLGSGLSLRESPWGGTEVPLRAEARATKRAGVRVGCGVVGRARTFEHGSKAARLEPCATVGWVSGCGIRCGGGGLRRRGRRGLVRRAVRGRRLRLRRARRRRLRTPRSNRGSSSE